MPTAVSAVSSARTKRPARSSRDSTSRTLMSICVAISRVSSAADSHSAPSSVTATRPSPCSMVSADTCVLPIGSRSASSSVSIVGSTPAMCVTTPSQTSTLTLLITARTGDEFGNSPRSTRATARTTVSDANTGTASLGNMPLAAP